MESILATGGLSGAPEEWIDYQLMKRMHWDWDQLERCPAYVRTYCMDFVQMEIDAAKKVAANGHGT